MADYFTKLCFAVPCTAEQAALVDLALNFSGDDEPYPDELRAAFGPIEDFAANIYDQAADDLWFSCDADATYGGGELVISGYQANPWAIANVLRVVLQPELPIGFQYANDCSSDRLDAFGGGAVAIFKDRVVIEDTTARLEALLRG
ncbi:hypothetical protein [Sphingomonas jaspsi]|uniref:hypothetical protein n=1 Tax=Sphingomonas jaspsi TaxID=392409 RepID=UPI0004B980B1|nr:hypothetical protein [Sphingomonas jaspsi]